MAEQSTSAGRAASPRVAVILLWYPLFTQPFIFRDVMALKARLPVEVHTLYGVNTRLCSQEMLREKDACERLGTRAVLRVLGSNIKLLFTRPRLYLSLFRDAVCRSWGSFEILGENLWAFLCGVHLAPILKRRGIDCLYAPWPRGTATAARTVRKLTGIPYVVTVRANNLLPADADLVDKMRDAALVRTNNKADKKRILALAPETKVEVIYNCLTLHADRAAPVPMSAPVRLLAAGRFDVTKGFDVLIKALALLKQRGIACRLTLVGGGGKIMGLGSMDSSLHQLCHDLDLENDVSFPGLLSHDAFPDILCSHDIFAAPCVVASDGQCDGIPNTLIEAMSFGLPVVASDVNAIPEIVHNRETGLLVPQRDPAALADAVAALVADPDTARRYGAAAAALASTLFAPEQNGALLTSLFIRQFGHGD